MDDIDFKIIAEQLRKPHGELAIEGGQKMNEGNKEIYHSVLDELNHHPNQEIMGMGNGYFVKNVLSISESINYYGCDYSKQMVTKANNLNKAFIDNKIAEFHFADVENLPIDSKRFDCVFSVNSLSFWKMSDKAIREISRVLKKTWSNIDRNQAKTFHATLPLCKTWFQNVFKRRSDSSDK